MMGVVPNYGIQWTWTDRGGRKLNIPRNTYIHSPTAKKMRDQSLIVHGGRIFNMLPREIRDHMGTKDTFKSLLDGFLMNIPDQPACDGLLPEPVDRISCKNSNSLYDWIMHLKLTDRKFTIVGSDSNE